MIARILIAVVLLFRFAALSPAADPSWPGDDWERAAPADVGMDGALLEKAREYALGGGGSGMITRHGKLVMAWGDLGRRYDLKSTTKSIGVTALGLAILDGKMKLSDKAGKFHPSLAVPPESNRKSGWIDGITLWHLATQTAGFEKPGGYTRLLFTPGSKWNYSDGGPNWLAECVTLVYCRDVRDLMFQRVFSPLGIQPADLAWRNNAYRDRKINGVARREFGSGISANVDAMARLGYLYLREGRWKDQRILPAEFVRAARTTPPELRGLEAVDAKRFGNAADHYGLLWWNNSDGALEAVPRDAYWSWGLYDSVILVIPSLDVVASRAGKSWKGRFSGHYDVLAGFFEPIAQSIKQASAKKSASRPRSKSSATSGGADRAPYPPSPVIQSIRWSPKSSIVRKARGGDNWPLTWGDDGHLYTAYGDGHGFEPKVRGKLSLGLARVEGTPDGFHGVNIRSASAEQRGGGASGKKASGMLMSSGVLYMWVRNAGNAQLAYSADRGRTWEWASWKLTESFGHPTFLNFGKDYAKARDEFVYIYSHDNDSAYKPAGSMVLARVHRGKLKDRQAYEFFSGLEASGRPTWHKDVSRRKAVFEHQGRCYRSGVTFNAGLKRYLWCQIIPGGDTRFKGGFGVYDAPQPWGPWTTVYFTESWDVGPGECSSFPAKWMSDDGKTIHLVFSGDDCFSVRRAELTLTASR